MPYELFATPAAAKLLKKLPDEVKAHLLSELQILKNSPLAGQQLKGKLRVLRSFHTRYKNSDYRVAYQVREAEQSITIWYVATRENFYRQLEKLPLKLLR